MVSAVSLLPLAAALLSVFLAGFALTTTGARNRTTRLFIAMNLGNALWCVAHFVQLNVAGPVDSALAAPMSPAHGLLVVQALGVALAPTYGFLFGAAYAHRERWLHGWRLALAHVPLVYTFAVAVTNPWHRLFITGESGASYAYGPLAPFHQVAGMVLGVAGFALIISTAWKRGTVVGRRQAIVIGVSALVPMAGGVVWMLRHRLGLDLSVNLSPVLSPVAMVALGFELLRTGLADIAPFAALQAFDAITDGAIALDNDGVVVAVNRVAAQLFPSVRVGRGLETHAELSSAAETCLRGSAGYTGFDLEIEGLLYWVRVRRTTDRHDRHAGCVVLLSDVTELRATQARIVELSRAVGEDYRGESAASAPSVERRRAERA